jgi:hypothetical protein
VFTKHVPNTLLHSNSTGKSMHGACPSPYSPAGTACWQAAAAAAHVTCLESKQLLSMVNLTQTLQPVTTRLRRDIHGDTRHSHHAISGAGVAARA